MKKIRKRGEENRSGYR